MRLIFIRHGEPDYSVDGLTENGFREAEALAKRVAEWQVDKVFCSPYGRAVETMLPSLRSLGGDLPKNWREVVTGWVKGKEIPKDWKVVDENEILPPSMGAFVPSFKMWLHEFGYSITNPTHKRTTCCWDYIPSDWANYPEYYTQYDWLNIPPASDNPDIKKHFLEVHSLFDAFLAEFGYHRNGNYYLATPGKNRRILGTVLEDGTHTANHMPDEDAGETLVFFCHFGIICVILSHLLNIPFATLANGTVISTSGVTIVNTEERWDNQVSFRMQTLGDVTHLLKEGVPISSAGSFAPLFKK